MKSPIHTLVLSGGGIRGVVYCGVFKKLKELHQSGQIDLAINRVTCVSVGTIFGLVYVLGYQPEEIEEEVMTKNFSHLKDIRFANFINKFGIDSGRNIITWLETLILKRGLKRGITFQELYQATGIRFQVLATNLKKFKYTLFDFENTPDVAVTQAIRFSISLPFVFTAEKYQDEIHIDGGVINNYPIHLYEDNLDGVLGIRIVNHDALPGKENSRNIKEFDSYVMSVWACFTVQRERQFGLQDKYKTNTITIYTGDFTQIINFAMNVMEKQKLIDVGYCATETYFIDTHSTMEPKSKDK
jgi:NTE family protein